MASLADLIAGSISGDAGPLGPEELQAARGQQLTQQALDNSQWANQGIGGALAHAIAGFAGPRIAQGGVNDITLARSAAIPDLAAAYAAPDPFQWAAQNPQADPVARWAVLSQSPTQVAAAKNAIADAAYRRAMAGVQQLQIGMRTNLLSGGNPSGYATSPPAGAGGGAGGGAGVGTPLPSGVLGNGHYTAADTGDGGGPAAPDPMAAIPRPGPDRAAWYAKLTPAQRTTVLQRLRR